jgi:hypothetical protein
MNKACCFLVTIWAVTALNQLSAQSVSSSVIGNAGAQEGPTGNTIQFTVGEQAVGSFNTGQHLLTEGFQQNNLTISALDEPTQQLHIQIYPNPTESTLFISGKELSSNTQLILFDLIGRVVMISNKKADDHTLQLDISSLTQGTYVIQINDNLKQYHYKVVKQ